jgi:hypothetical protein
MSQCTTLCPTRQMVFTFERRLKQVFSGIRMSNINIQYSNNGNVSRPCHDWRPGPGYDELPGGGEGDIVVPSNIDGLWIGGETAVNCSLKNSSLQKIGNETFWGVCVNETNSSIEMSNVECDWQ